MLISRGLSHPKEFGVSDFNEDASSCSEDASWFAISDGVGSALFSDIWSRALCHAVCSAKAILGEASFDAAILAAREQWYSEIDWESLDYFRKKKFSRQGGSFATLLFGMVDKSAVNEAGEVAIRLWSYGDCDMFQLRRGQCVGIWPWSRAADFGPSPPSLCSTAGTYTDNSAWQSHIVKLQPGDAILLATDALAEFLVKQIQSEQETPWESFLSISQTEFANWIEDLRNTNRIERDDTTFLLITHSDVPVAMATGRAPGIWLHQQLFSGWRHIGSGWGRVMAKSQLTWQ